MNIHSFILQGGITHSKSIFHLVEYLVRIFDEMVIHFLHRNDQLTTLSIQLLKKLEKFVFTRKIKYFVIC